MVKTRAAREVTRNLFAGLWLLLFVTVPGAQEGGGQARIAVPEDGTVHVDFEVSYLTPHEAAKLAVGEAATNGRLCDFPAWPEVERDLQAAVDFLGQAPDLPHLVKLRQEWEMKVGLHAIVDAEEKLDFALRADDEATTGQVFTMLRDIRERADAYPRPGEIDVEARDARLRSFALLRVSAIVNLPTVTGTAYVLKRKLEPGSRYWWRERHPHPDSMERPTSGTPCSGTASPVSMRPRAA
jgi:hypothetical protein